MKYLVPILGLALGLAIAGKGMAAAPASGEQIFQTRCKVCHSVAPDGSSSPIAPNLRGVVGRKAAASAFRNYSPALKASNLTWSQPKLDEYLQSPGKLVPGTRMVVSVTDAQQRKALIGYLAAQH